MFIVVLVVSIGASVDGHPAMLREAHESCNLDSARCQCDNMAFSGHAGRR